MLTIRLTRTGKAHHPHYRIVVQEKRSKLDGKAVEIIGHYHPADKEKLVVIDKERAEYWISKGAQPSDTVTNLLVREKILEKSATVHSFFTPTKKEDVKKEEKTEKVEVEQPEEVVAETEEVAIEEVADKVEESKEADIVADQVEEKAE